MIEGLGIIAKLKYSDFNLTSSNFVTLSRYMGVRLAGLLIIQAKCNMQHNKDRTENNETCLNITLL